jgi:hydroxymethylpyrimidine pyrophosphatase-like HAD family hydrolase
MSIEYIPSSPDTDIPFETPAFTISHLADTTEGFEFRTNKAIGRTEALNPDQSLVLDDDQRERLKQGFQGEKKFNNAASVEIARAEWHEAIEQEESSEKIKELRAKFDDARTAYINKGKKIGLRALHSEGTDVLSANVQLVAYPVFNNFASPENSSELQNLSSASGAAMILRTADNRIIVQHRAVTKQKLHEDGYIRGNGTYPDIPGASIAGLVDASLRGSDRKPGTPDPVTTSTIVEGILKEAGEELGLSPDHVRNIRLMGMTQDKIKIQDGFLLIGDSDLTADGIRESSRLSNLNKGRNDADFEESFIDINGSPQAIKTLLTDVHCPLAPAHAATLVAAGYAFVLEKEGLSAARTWTRDIEEGVTKNYAHIDSLVTKFYEDHPEAYTQVPERFWGKKAPIRSLTGYTPEYTPTEQGLPSFENEMVRTELTPEKRTVAKHALLFDVDGVLSDPIEKRVTQPELLTEIADQLTQGNPIGLNTGRSAEWVSENILMPLLDKVNDITILQNLIVIGEKGGTWTTFNKQGEAHNGKVKNISVDDELKNKLSDLVTEKYADTMFIDSTKQTMVSVEMRDNHDLAAFTQAQVEFLQDTQAILTETGNEQKYRIDLTTIATDIESPYVSKALGAQRFLDFLEHRKIIAPEFIAFGDSDSDLAMADELVRQGKTVDFVYVGNDPNLMANKHDYLFERVGGFSGGTAAYLAHIAS